MAWRPPAIADAPCRTSAGVLGIARTTGRLAGRAASSVAIVTPAAIDSTRASVGSDGSACSRARRRRRRASPRRTTTSASATAHAGLGTTRTLGNRCLEDAAALGVDLGDRERVGVPAAVEQPADAAPRPSARRRAAPHASCIG